MESKKRNCIFTGEPADAKISVSHPNSDRHNWAKKVPCTKDFLVSRGDKPLTDLEMNIVELFYKKELAELRVQVYEKELHEMQSKLKKDWAKYYTDDFTNRVKERLSEENFGEKLIESTKEALRHARGEVELRTTCATSDTAEKTVSLTKEDSGSKIKKITKKKGDQGLWD